MEIALNYVIITTANTLDKYNIVLAMLLDAEGSFNKIKILLILSDLGIDQMIINYTENIINSSLVIYSERKLNANGFSMSQFLSVSNQLNASNLDNERP